MSTVVVTAIHFLISLRCSNCRTAKVASTISDFTSLRFICLLSYGGSFQLDSLYYSLDGSFRTEKVLCAWQVNKESTVDWCRQQCAHFRRFRADGTFVLYRRLAHPVNWTALAHFIVLIFILHLLYKWRPRIWFIMYGQSSLLFYLTHRLPFSIAGSSVLFSARSYRPYRCSRVPLHSCWHLINSLCCLLASFCLSMQSPWLTSWPY